MNLLPNALGRLAYESGDPLSSCPYPPSDIAAVEWEGGWMEAEEESMGDE